MLAFQEGFSANSLFYVDQICNIFFVADIFVNFNTVYTDEELDQIDSRRVRYFIVTLFF
jgi:hypothetical protein